MNLVKEMMESPFIEKKHIPDGKRTRGQNFTEKERKIFLDLVVPYREIFNSKITTKEFLSAKYEAWNEVTTKFNSVAGTDRAAKQLKSFYDNLKVRTRKAKIFENDLNPEENQKEIEFSEYETNMVNIKNSLTVKIGNVPDVKDSIIKSNFFVNSSENGDNSLTIEDLDRNTETKRQRGQNFTDQERKILLDILPMYKNIIDSKDYHTEGLKLKANTWELITKKFNELSETDRPVKQIKTFYDNLKSRMKRSTIENVCLSENNAEKNCSPEFVNCEGRFQCFDTSQRSQDDPGNSRDYQKLEEMQYEVERLEDEDSEEYFREYEVPITQLVEMSNAETTDSRTNNSVLHTQHNTQHGTKKDTPLKKHSETTQIRPVRKKRVTKCVNTKFKILNKELQIKELEFKTLKKRAENEQRMDKIRMQILEAELEMKLIALKKQKIAF